VLRARRLPGRLAAAVLLIAAACSSPEERFAAHVSRAEGHLAEGRTDDALIELQSALKIRPDDPDVNERLGALLEQRGSHQAAAFHYGEAYRLDPQRVEAAVEQAVLLWQTAPGRAQQILADVTQRFPDDPRVHRGEATLAIAAGQYDVALQAAQRAIELAPADEASWASLGAVYMERTRDARARKQEPDPADYQAGIAAFEKLDELAGGHVGARVEKARLLGNLGGRDDEAVAAFRSAIELARQQQNPGSVLFAAQRFAGFASRRGSLPLEIEALRVIVDTQPGLVRQWEALAHAVERQDGREAGEAVYAELLEAQPELPAAHVAYASFLTRTQRPLDAIAHLDRAIAGGLDSPQLWEQLVNLELGLRRIADARATVEEMKSRIGDHEATRRSEVRLAVREERAAEALELLKGFEGREESADTELLRATALRQLDNPAEAAAAAERAVALSPGRDATALRLLAAIRGDAGDFEAALRALDQIRARGHRLTAQEQLIEARGRYAQGDAARGLAILEGLLASERPPTAAAVEYAARQGAEKPDEARRHLALALRRAPGNHAALEAITRLDLAAGREPAALERLDKLVESQLAGPRVLLLRSQVLMRSGQLDRAEADALRAFEALPELGEAADMLFAIYTAQGRVEEARRSFEEADSVGVLHKGARVLLARLMVAQGDTEKARALYEKVLAEDDSMVAAKHDLARLLVAADSQDLDRALALAEQAQRAEPTDPAIADTVGYVYFLEGQYEVALQQFRLALDLASAIDIAPPAVHYHLGLALRALGRDPEAAAAFQRALEIDPKFEGADDAQSQLEAARATAAAGSG
jgi:tetratricopeptide (TPR) repeat protein